MKKNSNYLNQFGDVKSVVIYVEEIIHQKSVQSVKPKRRDLRYLSDNVLIIHHGNHHIHPLHP